MNGQQQELGGGPTPLETLADAVDAYLDAIGAEGSAQGFVLLAQTVVLDPEASEHGISPVGVGSHYATNLPAATGGGLASAFLRITDEVVSGSMRAWSRT